MQSLKSRIEQAEELWRQGEAAEGRGELKLAYALHTEAHDLILDCAQMHERAHQHLKRVNRQLGHYGEWCTDSLLALFAPLGVFELVSYFAKSGSFGHELCRR